MFHLWENYLATTHFLYLSLQKEDMEASLSLIREREELKQRIDREKRRLKKEERQKISLIMREVEALEERIMRLLKGTYEKEKGVLFSLKGYGKRQATGHLVDAST